MFSVDVSDFVIFKENNQIIIVSCKKTSSQHLLGSSTSEDFSREKLYNFAKHISEFIPVHELPTT